MLHGTADETIPYANGKKIYADAKSPKFLVSLIGAPHVSFLQVAAPGTKAPRWENVDVQSVTDFLQLELDHMESSLNDLEEVANHPGLSSIEEEP